MCPKTREGLATGAEVTIVEESVCVSASLTQSSRPRVISNEQRSRAFESREEADAHRRRFVPCTKCAG